MLENKTYYLYEIKIGGIRRYVGITNDLKLRQKQHNMLLKNGKNKILYNNIRRTTTDLEIKLVKLKKFVNKVEARRFECLIILMDHFKKKQLWQRVPRISDI